MVKQSRVAEVARRAYAARKKNWSTYTEGSAVFDLDKGAYCARFIRQCHEAAAGLPPFGFPFSAPNAREMEKKLKAAGKEVVGPPQPGDIIGLNDQAFVFGHIGIFLGNGLFAENTSSASRGDPRAAGTKISPVSAVLHELSGWYRPFEGDEIRLVVQAPDNNWRVVECNLEVKSGVSRVDLRPVVEALGFQITDHIADQSKIYVTRV